MCSTLLELPQFTALRVSHPGLFGSFLLPLGAAQKMPALAPSPQHPRGSVTVYRKMLPFIHHQDLALRPRPLAISKTPLAGMCLQNKGRRSSRTSSGVSLIETEFKNCERETILIGVLISCPGWFLCSWSRSSPPRGGLLGTSLPEVTVLLTSAHCSSQ